MWLFDELFLAIKVILRWIIKILNNSVSVAWDNQRQNNHQLLQLSRRNPLSLSLTLTLSMFQFLSISNHVNHKIQQVLQSNLDLQRFNEELILWNPGADISLTYWRWRAVTCTMAECAQEEKPKQRWYYVQEDGSGGSVVQCEAAKMSAPVCRPPRLNVYSDIIDS